MLLIRPSSMLFDLMQERCSKDVCCMFVSFVVYWCEDSSAVWRELLSPRVGKFSVGVGALIREEHVGGSSARPPCESVVLVKDVPLTFTIVFAWPSLLICHTGRLTKSIIGDDTPIFAMSSVLAKSKNTFFWTPLGVFCLRHARSFERSFHACER
ncbi:hypothetical protein IW261DRAFT_6318 [Armillaria novae-zelandiae]|uniref:Uncharacterized protein n=1 Tax=Armillaria novae-zelandiae TaxID=153914 RepID=A0AA39PTM7_9AGAR|nr:hypothetical protein IW261DRAFT_6318 [Armillaria novae-zelandiae]